MKTKIEAALTSLVKLQTQGMKTEYRGLQMSLTRILLTIEHGTLSQEKHPLILNLLAAAHLHKDSGGASAANSVS